MPPSFESITPASSFHNAAAHACEHLREGEFAPTVTEGARDETRDSGTERRRLDARVCQFTRNKTCRRQLLPPDSIHEMWTRVNERREHYREQIPLIFGATAELYYAHWGEFLHLAVFDAGEDPVDFDAALERTHARYLEALGGVSAGRILSGS